MDSDGFSSTYLRYAGASSCLLGDGTQQMNQLAIKFLFGLMQLGVDLDSVAINEKDGLVSIDFQWQYYGSASLKKRTLTFITADITKPATYPPALMRIVTAGFDLFYMKGAFLAPKSYPEFLPFIANFVTPGGWLMTADKTFIMESFDPEPCLTKAGLSFVQAKAEETRICEELLEPPFDPLVTVPCLERFSGAERRSQRTPGSDLSYWAMLTLRQKQ